jgi:hypothetical protein
MEAGDAGRRHVYVSCEYVDGGLESARIRTLVSSSSTLWTAMTRL